MTVDDVNLILESIRANSSDPEAAHGIEDGLYVFVLESIANGVENAQELAKAALQADEIDFPRWRA